MTTHEGDAMNYTTAITTCEVYWDHAAGDDAGWAYCYRRPDGEEESGSVGCDLDRDRDADPLALARAVARLLPVDEVTVYSGDQARLKYRGEDDWRYL